MNSPRTRPPVAAGKLRQLHETQNAFDSVAADHDGNRGNNALIQDMRKEMWRWLDATFTPDSRLAAPRASVTGRWVLLKRGCTGPAAAQGTARCGARAVGTIL